MTPPPIPEEAVERAARAVHTLRHIPVFNGKPQQAIVEDVVHALQASGALYLTEEEKRALFHWTPAFCIPDCPEALDSARQKLEESLNG